ncbi:MAG: serpin family protein [Myxococcales bacterium]
MGSSRWAAWLVLTMACNSAKQPAGDVPKSAPKPALEEPEAPPAEPTPGEGIEEVAEPPVPEQEDSARPHTSNLPPSLVLAANQLALRMLRDLEPGRVNLVLAPITATLALQMTLPGAREQTARELEKALAIKPGQGLLLAKELARLATAPGAGNALHVASGFYADEAMSVAPAFARELREGYHASSFSVPFSKSPESARERINQDIATHTGGRLERLLGPGSIDSLTRAVLVSAVAMQAVWKDAFNPQNTHDGPFTPSGKPAVSVPFMERQADYALGMLGEDTTVLELPYAGGELSMVIVLPGGESMPKEAFDADVLGRTLERLEPAKAKLQLPRFTAKLDSVELIPMLKELGIKALFSSQADLSGIAGKPGDLYVSHVLHGAFVDVNEKGTEASGATAVGIRTRALPAPVPVLTINRPFAFLIRQVSSGLVLFAGRIGDPSIKAQ